MSDNIKERFEPAGWAVGDAAEFLQLSTAEGSLVEIRLVLASALRQHREELEITQTELAQKLSSSQSRVAKMEAADISVTVDLLVRALLTIGRTRQEIGHLLTN